MAEARPTLLISVSGLALVLAVSQPDTVEYTVYGHDREAGGMRVITDADSAVVRYNYQDRQRGPRLNTLYHFNSEGVPVRIEVRGLASGGIARSGVSESFELGPVNAVWIVGTDTSVARIDNASFYSPRESTPFDNALLAAFLLRQPGRATRLLPAGEARAEVVAETTLTLPGGQRGLRLVAIHAVTLSPILIWLGDDDRLFASHASWFITVEKGWQGALPHLRRIEQGFNEQRSAAAARRFSRAPRGTILIRNGDVFDSEQGVVRPRTSILVVGDRIALVGPAESVRAPPGATVIDATGRTVLPGLWDMHAHMDVFGDQGGALNLASGVTTVRDMWSDLDVVASVRRRTEAGTLIGPRALLAGFIEGPGHWAGPTDVIVRTEDEARRWVARYDSLGYKQIKLYNLLHPDLVPAIAQEAKARGMRLSGHVPRGLSLPAALGLGFDEVNHIAFLISTFYQDSLYVPHMRMYSQVAAAVAPTFDVESPDVTALIVLLRTNGTVVDPTVNAFIPAAARGLPDGTDLIFGATLERLPPLQRRAYTPAPATDAQEAVRAQATAATYLRLIKRLYEGGVKMVAGTDNLPGLSLHGELELYEHAGIPAPAVLQIATIVPARVMNDDLDYGSIAAGKVADLVIVRGRPAERIRDLRRTETIVRAGVAYSADELYRAAGLSPAVSSSR